MDHISDHATAATKFNKDEARVKWHDETLWFVREKRDKAAHGVADWEKLRDAASSVKSHMLSNIDKYLMQFEANATRNGVVVHWAADAKEHNDIVLSIMRSNNIMRVVKSKSMLTEECGLNEYLASNEI